MKYGTRVKITSGFYEGIGFIVGDKDNSGSYEVKRGFSEKETIIHEITIRIAEHNLEITN